MDKNKRIVYISGKITGIAIEEAMRNFNEAENKLKNEFDFVVNPMKLPHNHNKSWNSYMRECIIALMNCTHLFCLKNVKRSRGAKIEIELALNLGIKIRTQ